MMIKITEKCSMGCTHCMNNASCNGKHMDATTFKKALEFQKVYGGPFCLITGGEPIEHPDFFYYLTMAMKQLDACFITVATNGVWMQDNMDFVMHMNNLYGDRLIFQVTNDERYYPIRIDWQHPVFHLDNVVTSDKVPRLYPQGRTLSNNLEWEAKGSKCFNVRAAAHQITFKDLRMLIAMLAVKGKFCTPHISIDGHIKVGESDLCPNCSHIDKSNYEIMDDIINFRCSQCNHVNCALPTEYRQVIGED